MNFSKFKAGTDKQQYQYKSFSPEKINTTWIWDDPILNVLMEKGTRKLGELNAFTLIVPNIDLFIQMHIIKEANTSSKIEGTQTNIDEAQLPEEEIALEKRDDWQEVQDYINAMNYAIDKLEKLPTSNRLLNKTHEILMKGVRGEHQSPGDFRTSQNWIDGSSFFEKHRSSYYDALSIVREANDISHWVKFFLNAVIDTAEDGKKTFILILELKKETDSFLFSLGGRAGNANKILELFYQKPALNVKEIEKALSMNQRTIRNVLNTLEKENFIVEYTGNKRNKKYIFQRYLKLFY